MSKTIKNKAKRNTKTNGGTIRKQPRRTPEELRLALREYDIDTTIKSQLRAIGTVYRVATHENEVDLRTLLAAIGKVQNLWSLTMRSAQLQKATGFKGDLLLGN